MQDAEHDALRHRRFVGKAACSDACADFFDVLF
jgi:hypothetical protein